MGNRTPDSFGALLKEFRVRRHLTQQQLADVIGVHRNVIGRWEQGNVLPATKSTVLELIKHLQLDGQEARSLLEASLTGLSPYWLVPFHRNLRFTGREEVLKVLHMHLLPERALALTQSCALYGLGGIGKTQIALEYAYRYALEYTAVFWISAETTESIVASFLSIAEVLHLPERRETNQRQIVSAVRRWLTSHGQWLLIWDNMEELELLERFLPPTRHGCVLITARRQAFGTLAHALELSALEQEEGVLFLLRRTNLLGSCATNEDVCQLAQRLPAEYAAARELVQLMAGLPLALDQAGAYVDESGCSIASYLLQYRCQYHQLLARRGTLTTNHPHSVATTLLLSCQQVEQHNPGALELLRHCAFLFPDTIPEELFVVGAPYLSQEIGSVASDSYRFDQALAALRLFSLIRRHPETQTLSIHRLIQVILLAEMSKQERAEYQRRVISMLYELFPEVEYGSFLWGACERLLPHVLAAVSIAPDDAGRQKVAGILRKAASYLRECARYEQAESLFKRAIGIYEQVAGPEHPELAAAFNGLAHLYYDRAHYRQAESLFRRAIGIYERVSGPEHLDLASPLRGMALLFYRQGKYKHAEELYQRALRIQIAALGPEHQQTAYLLDNMAILYVELGKYEKAEPLLQRALQIWEQALGPEHSQISRPLNNLADLYLEQGRYEKAEPLLQQSLRILELTLGSQHPRIAYAVHNLADIYLEQGRYEKAELFYKRALRLWERAFGDEHPNRAYSLHGLARMHRAKGEYGQAERLYKQAIGLRARHRGLKHYETAKSMYGLAELHVEKGEYMRAERLYIQAVKIFEHSLGLTHPQVVKLRTAYSCLLEKRKRGTNERNLLVRLFYARNRSDGAIRTLTREKPATQILESEALTAFLVACCDLHPQAWARSADLWRTYQQWVQEHQERFPLSRQAFTSYLKAHGCQAARTNSARIWRGIGIIDRRRDMA
ncbi:FxSxx-COOH system tetratricopeptide repeat protein [Ktedonosporobacter rubrisoli]|nr:FxSxx-COOH system tetratricopeptide repeat protein [Ktedonosporobacter rubrisoli]